jgi:hypothetical protein
MEILAMTEVMKVAWYVPLIIAVFFISGIMAIIAASNDAYITLAICALLSIASIILILTLPTEIPNGQMSYTIEITNPEQYQILIEKGYSFKRLFENKEIYTIIGDALQ